MYKAIIVEDEASGLAKIKHLLKKDFPSVKIIGEARSNEEAEDLLLNLAETPDIGFLDINLPDGEVFNLLDRLDTINFEVIFTTAYSEYAVKACEFSNVGYLIKPIEKDGVQKSLDRIRQSKGLNMDQRLEAFHSYYAQPNAMEKMMVTSLEGYDFIKLRDIVRFEAEDNYTHIHLANGTKITASKTIKSYEEIYEKHNFYRVHKRHVVNLNYISKFVRSDGGYLLMEDNEKVEISRRRRNSFLERLRNLR